MAEAKIKINIDEAIIKGIMKYAQDIADKYGFRIDDISFEWQQICEIGDEPKFILRNVDLKTSRRLF